MSAGAAAVDLRQADEAERLYEAARSFVPRIRALAREQEINRRLDDKLVDDIEAAGLLSVLVPKRWGGSGLGPIETGKIVEILGSGDCSTAWVCSFFMLHNWFVCRLPLETQQQLYANTNSVRAAGVFGPPSVAEKVEGGYRVSGRWSYASGILHAPYSFCPAMVGDVMWFGPLKKFQKLFFHTPLVNLFVMGSEAYHDYYRWPLRDRRVFEQWRAQTTWGQLFDHYQVHGTLAPSESAKPQTA